MIREMLAEQMEEAKQLLQGNGKKVTAPIFEPKVNEDQSEEGSYSNIVDQTEPQVVRRNRLDRGIDMNGYKYKDFMT